MDKKQVLHFRVLNGIRAIAAIAVLISHISGQLPDFGLNPIFTDNTGQVSGFFLASFGVTMFFALSGFLITYLLLREKEKQPIYIKHFYVRRVLWIWPLYYMFMAICVITYFIFDVDYYHPSLLFYFFFGANIAMIANAMLPFMGHLWSIGVEEQFYIFWPWMARLENKKLLKYSFLFVAVFYGLKFLLYVLQTKFPFLNIGLVALGVSRFHVMIMGCIGAILYYNDSKYISYLTHKWTQAMAWLILVLATLNMFHISSSLIDHEIIALVTIVIIFGQICRKNMIIDLDQKWFNFIGKISNGIYVIHPLLIFLSLQYVGKFAESTLINYILLYGLIIFTTVLLSSLSYEFLDNRFLVYKDRFAKIKSRA
jgi:peptidoglycan/LPS O-acetylase OafA/YrhL